MEHHEARETTAENRTGVRLARALLGYYLTVVAVIVLAPFQFVVPERLAWQSVIDVPDFLANILLFIPFGFLYTLSRQRGGGAGGALRVLGVGAAASLGIELVQMLEPERYPSLLDVLANGLGAFVGGRLCAAVSRHLEASALVGRLSLELPLMGLVYLLVPLFWVGSLAIGDNTLRLWMLALPAVFGATLLGMVQRHHFGPAAAVSARAMALAAAGGVLLGGFPALARAPGAVLTLAALAAAVVLRHALLPATTAERRFEVPALRMALPFYAAYLAACALVPLTEAPTPLGVAVLAGGMDVVRTVEILRLLHVAAAFTLFGYMIAEFRGRFEPPFAANSLRVLAFSTPPALAAVAVSYFAVGAGGGVWSTPNGVLWLLLAVGGAQYGAWLYHLQLDHVRALVQVRNRRAGGDAGSGAMADGARHAA